MTPGSTLRVRLGHAGLLRVCERICAEHGFTLEACATSHRKGKTRARHRCWYVIRSRYRWSYPEIGELWGVDHTSVILGVRKARLEAEARLQDLGERSTPGASSLSSRPADAPIGAGRFLWAPRAAEMARGLLAAR